MFGVKDDVRIPQEKGDTALTGIASVLPGAMQEAQHQMQERAMQRMTTMDHAQVASASLLNGHGKLAFSHQLDGESDSAKPGVHYPESKIQSDGIECLAFSPEAQEAADAKAFQNV